ncbi:methyltransferase domain-containing protein [candidate division KSB1 bacterium]|nr:methyltransferase domain-containing protein [candidate division KSB1 bacterium]
MLDHFDIIAPIYDKILDHSDHGTLRKLLQLPENGLLLDAGGGTGRVSSKFQSAGLKVIISDLSLKMLSQVDKKNSLIPVAAHAECLPFADNTFDRIVVVDALHHFCSQQESLANLIRVLKPGGRMVIEEPDIRRLPARLIAIAEKILLMRSHFLSPPEIEKILYESGVKAFVEDENDFASWVVAEK